MDKKTLEQIKKIKILCNKNTNFLKIPEDMINSEGKKNYAYVTFVMSGDTYIAPAIVLAESIRKLGSMADLVVLVTKDVSIEGKEILKIFYDYVEEVEYINFENQETTIKENSAHLNMSFTKFRVFNLTQYKKILLVDADTIILKYPDHLFTLNSPAGVYLPNKEEIITYDNGEKRTYNKKIEWFNKYCKCCSHGKIISKSITDKIEEGLSKDKNNLSAISGGLILLEPSEEEFNKILKDINTLKMSKIINKLIWPFQQYLTMRYSGNWTSIEPIFLGLDGFPHWSVLNALHFSKNKPFKLENKYSIEARVNFEDFQLWYKFYRDITNRYPELLDSKVLNEPNLISKYFICQLSRKTMAFKKILTSGISSNISKIFKIQITSNYYYYHINISKEYDNESINYSFENNYIYDMVKQTVNNTKSKYWEKIYDKIINKNIVKQFMEKNTEKFKEKFTDVSLSNEINLKTLDIFAQEDKENIISYYTKINSNVCIIMVITTEKTETNFWLDNKLISNIFYQKEINLSGTIFKNIMFNIVQTYSYSERIDKLNNIFSDVTNYKIKLLFYKTIIDAELKGNNNDIYVFSDANSKNRVLSILLNSNTLNKFINREIIFIPEKQNKLYHTLTENNIFIKNMLMFQSLKKWIYNNYDGNDIDNIIVISKLELSDKRQMEEIILLDTNQYETLNENKYLEIDKKKLAFMNVFFTTKMKKISAQYKNIIDNIHDLRHYYQLDGIKFLLQ